MGWYVCGGVGVGGVKMVRGMEGKVGFVVLTMRVVGVDGVGLFSWVESARDVYVDVL